MTYPIFPEYSHDVFGTALDMASQRKTYAGLVPAAYAGLA
jgi:hypothetical protein